jgi:hypothetical protein
MAVMAPLLVPAACMLLLAGDCVGHWTPCLSLAKDYRSQEVWVRGDLTWYVQVCCSQGCLSQCLLAQLTQQLHTNTSG